MDSWSLLLGLFIAVFGGAFIQWAIIEKAIWGRHAKKHKMPRKENGSLSWLVGMLERVVYVICLVGAAREWIAVWLTLKTIVKWKGWKEDARTFNIYLIGNIISIILSLLGAWIAVRMSLPEFLALVKKG
jgi:hypothetical protein